MIAGRIIIALLVAIAVLGVTSAAGPHSSAIGIPTSGTDDLDETMQYRNPYSGPHSGGAALELRSYTNDTTKPIAKAGQDRTANVGQKITFDARGSTDNTYIVNYTWSFVAGPENGTVHRLYGPVVNFTFEQAREYNVMLSVTDSAGNVCYDEMTVTVEITGGMGSVLGGERDLLAFSVALVLAAVLVIDILARRRRKVASRPSVQEETPPPKIQGGT